MRAQRFSLALPVCAAWLLLLGLALPGCRGAPPAGSAAEPPSPMLVVGIDGAEWRVIHRLWEQGRLPHLEALAEGGVSARLRTRYSASPVIWTTIATGMRPEEHGIVDFVVPTEDGDVPVSSTLRRVPAIWNMLAAAGRRVAVLGWWASWPAEGVDGVVVSDRIRHPVEGRVFPPEMEAEVLAELERVRGGENPFTGNAATRERDLLMTRLGERMASEGYDLLLVYYRGVDIVSHNHWKHYEPEAFAETPPSAEEIAAYGELIPREYEAVDAALGRLLAAARPTPNVLVISDHGFHAARREIVKVGLDFDRLLERLGYLERDAAGAVDLSRSSLLTQASPEYRPTKWVRFAAGDALGDGEKARLRRALEADLARVTYETGGRAFRVRDAAPEEIERGAAFVVEVRLEGAAVGLLLDGDPRPLAGLVREVRRVSGTHGERTHGIFVAAGPDIDPEAEVEGIGIHDVTPTLLYGLGLPVAEDFAGKAVTALFRPEFRRRHPLRTIPTWGAAREGKLSTSEADQELVRELRALGYLD